MRTYGPAITLFSQIVSYYLFCLGAFLLPFDPGEALLTLAAFFLAVLHLGFRFRRASCVSPGLAFLGPLEVFFFISNSLLDFLRTLLTFVSLSSVVVLELSDRFRFESLRLLSGLDLVPLSGLDPALGAPLPERLRGLCLVLPYFEENPSSIDSPSKPVISDLSIFFPRSSSTAASLFLSALQTNECASPFSSARPVRPIRCT